MFDRFFQHTAEKSRTSYERDSQTISMEDDINGPVTGVSGLMFESAKISGQVNKSL